MNEIIIDTCSLPAVISGAYEVASVPFIHADRTTDFHVLIYVTEGYIGVTEDEQDYTIQKGELFFLKSVFIITVRWKSPKEPHGTISISALHNPQKTASPFR